jgi:hypothetical protein
VNTLAGAEIGAPILTAAPICWAASVSFRKRLVTSRWVDFEWDTASVIVFDTTSAEPCGPQETSLAGELQWRYDHEPITLHVSEGEGYWLNLNSPAPCIFVMWRLDDTDANAVPRPVVVTLSYNEAGRMLDAGERVDNVPMPEALKRTLTDYVAANYKPEVKKKVRRNDPFAEGAYRRKDTTGAARE